jgi:hypothetical protein
MPAYLMLERSKIGCGETAVIDLSAAHWSLVKLGQEVESELPGWGWDYVGEYDDEVVFCPEHRNGKPATK